MDPHAEPQQHSLEPPSKRKRLTQACDMCRKKKIKCDGGKPSCANCVKLGRECSYIPSNKKRGPRQGYIEMLEKRLDKMEKLLTSSNDPSPGAAAAAASLPTPTAYTAAAIGTQSPTSPMHAAGFPVTPTAANPSAPNPLVIKPEYEPQGMPAPPPPPPPTSATAAAPPPTIDNSPSDGDLPNKSIVQHLITIYFDKLYSYAPIFDPRTFMRNYLDGKHSDFLLLSMMAVAARFSDHPSILEEPPWNSGEKYAKIARESISKGIDAPCLENVQAFALLAIHEFGAARSPRCWMYSGIAIRMAIELGMHKESDSDHDTQVDQPAERWMEQELRRRVFWFIYILDKFSSAATGRPAMIQEEDCDVLLPSDEYGWVNGRFYSESLDGSRMAQFNVNELRDSNLLGVSSKVSSTSSHSPPSSSASALNASKRMGTLTCQAYLIRATALLGRVAAFVNRTNRSRVLPPCHPESDFAKLARQIDEWHENLPAMYRYTPENIEKFKTAPTNHDTSRFVMLHLFLNTTIVLLHRPSLVLYDTLNSDVVQTPLKEFCKESVAKCLRAVNNVTALLKVANQSVEFMPPYLTYLCYTVATIVVNNAFSNIPDDAKKARDDLNHHFKLLQNMRRVWAMADKHYFMIRDLYAMHRNTTNSPLDHHSRSPSQASMSPSSTKWTSNGNASGTSGRSTHDVSPQSSFSQPSHQMSPTSATSQHAQPQQQQQQQQQPQPQPQPFPSLFPPTSIDHAHNGNNNQQQATNPAFHAINIPNRKMSLAELALSTCDGTSYSPWGVGDNRDNVTAALASSMNRSSSLMFSAQPPQQHQQQQQQPGLGLYDINGNTAMQNNNNPPTSAADTLAWNLGITDPVAYSRSS